MEMMERNRKLRLLVTTDCPNHCPMCCNNQFDFDKLKRVEDFDYDEIMITRGEPLLFPRKVEELARSIKRILNVVDGVVLTPHSKEDVQRFISTNRSLGIHFKYYSNRHPSLRLNLFKNIKDMLPEDIDLSLWQVKDIEWIKDCPVPKGEDFRRLPNLWSES